MTLARPLPLPLLRVNELHPFSPFNAGLAAFDNARLPAVAAFAANFEVAAGLEANVGDARLTGDAELQEAVIDAHGTT